MMEKLKLENFSELVKMAVAMDEVFLWIC